MTKHGCAVCQGNITDEMTGKILWTPGHRQPVCIDCINEYQWG